MRWKMLALALIAIALIPVLVVGYMSMHDETGDKENFSNLVDVTGTGTVVYLTFEGGFWGIIGDDGEHYDPANLDPEFKVKGLRVYFEAKIRHDLVSFHMWGKIIEILKIQKLTD